MTQIDKEFLILIKRRIAIVSVGGSAIRNQGAAGLVDIAREYFEKEIFLPEFFNSLKDEVIFKQFLDKHTVKLVEEFPDEGKSWGAARKGLNLFFRDLVYNKFIAEEYGLSTDFAQYNFEIRNLEIPLDSQVAQGIFQESKIQLPKWVSIKELTPEISSIYQSVALELANEMNIARVHLDLMLWRRP